MCSMWSKNEKQKNGRKPVNVANNKRWDVCAVWWLLHAFETRISSHSDTHHNLLYANKPKRGIILIKNNGWRFHKRRHSTTNSSSNFVSSACCCQWVWSCFVHLEMDISSNCFFFKTFAHLIVHNLTPYSTLLLAWASLLLESFIRIKQPEQNV